MSNKCPKLAFLEDLIMMHWGWGLNSFFPLEFYYQMFLCHSTFGSNGHTFGILHAPPKRPRMWSIWHKAVAINKWRARITPASISKQRMFCLPNISELIWHEFWNCVQARRAWRWAIFIMLELCGLEWATMIAFIGNKPSLGKDP